MKVINLDKIVTKRDRVIILGGKEHVMHTPTVKDYIDQMKQSDEIAKLGNAAEPTMDTAKRILELTIETLQKSFPTITKDQFQALNMGQLNALRGLAEDASAQDAGDEADESGEAEGKAE